MSPSPGQTSQTRETKNGKLTERRFEIIYHSATGDWVSAVSVATEALSPKEECSDLNLQSHTSYRVVNALSTGSLFGVSIEASMTPKTTQAERDHAGKIQWDCMTSRSECDGPSPYICRTALHACRIRGPSEQHGEPARTE